MGHWHHRRYARHDPDHVRPVPRRSCPPARLRCSGGDAARPRCLLHRFFSARRFCRPRHRRQHRCPMPCARRPHRPVPPDPRSSRSAWARSSARPPGHPASSAPLRPAGAGAPAVFPEAIEKVPPTCRPIIIRGPAARTDAVVAGWFGLYAAAPGRGRLHPRAPERLTHGSARPAFDRPDRRDPRIVSRLRITSSLLRRAPSPRVLEGARDTPPVSSLTRPNMAPLAVGSRRRAVTFSPSGMPLRPLREATTVPPSRSGRRPSAPGRAPTPSDAAHFTGDLSSLLYSDRSVIAPPGPLHTLPRHKVTVSPHGEHPPTVRYRPDSAADSGAFAPDPW